MRSSFTVFGDPVGKPRMTQRDKWETRDCVVRYREWCDKARLAATGSIVGRVREDVIGIIVFAHFKPPESHPARAGRVHRQKPDGDNILKATCDALFEDDSKIACKQVHKFWCCADEEPRVDVYLFIL